MIHKALFIVVLMQQCENERVVKARNVSNK